MPSLPRNVLHLLCIYFATHYEASTHKHTHTRRTSFTLRLSDQYCRLSLALNPDHKDKLLRSTSLTFGSWEAWEKARLPMAANEYPIRNIHLPPELISRRQAVTAVLQQPAERKRPKTQVSFLLPAQGFAGVSSTHL